MKSIPVSFASCKRNNLFVLMFSPEEQAFASKRRRRKTGRFNRKFPKDVFISK